MGRPGGILACSTLVALLAGEATPTHAQPPRGPALARVARALATLIEQDAHKGPSGLGKWQLALYYSAAPGASSPYGAYKLGVTTDRGALQEVAISEFATKAKPAFEAQPEDPTFSLEISHGSASQSRAWRGEVSYSSSGCTRSSAPGTPHLCTGFAKVLALSERNKLAGLKPLLAQAIGVVYKARHHAPVSLEDFTVTGPLVAESVGG